MLTHLALAVAAIALDAPNPGGSPGRAEVRSPFEGDAALLMIVPDGSRVRQGQPVAVLDTSAARERLRDQEARVLRLAAEAEAASKAREAAERDSGAARDGVDADLDAARGAIALAEADLARARDRAEWSGRMERDGMLPRSQALGDRLAIERARFDRERAQTQLRVVEEYSGPRRMAEARAALGLARESDLAARGRVALERIKAEELARRVAAGVVPAPAGGTFRRARPEEAGAVIPGHRRLGFIEAD